MAKKKEEVVNIKRTSKGVIVLAIALSILFVCAIIWLFVFIDSKIVYQEYSKFNYDSSGNVVVSNKIEITNITGRVQSQWNTYYVSADVKNISKHNFDNISVQFSLYDRDDMLIDRVSYDIEDLKEDETWKFSVVYDGAYVNEVAKYELSKITLY